MSPAKKAPPQPAPEPDARDDVRDLLAQFGATSIRAKLQRENPKDRQFEWLGMIDPVTPELVEEVQERFGGGHYRARLYNDAGYVKGGSIAFRIAGRPRPLDGDAPPPAPPPPADAFDGLKMAERIVAIATPILTLVVPLLKGSNGGSVTETLALMQGAEEKGRQIGRQLGRLESGSSETGMLSVADKYLPSVLSLIERKKPAPPESRLTTEPKIEVKTPTVYTPALAPEYAWLEPIRSHYHLLMAQAQHDADPVVVAEFTLTQLDDAQEQAVALAVQRPDFLETMRAELAPIASRYPEWLTEYLAGIVDAVRAQQEDVSPPEEPKREGKPPARKRSRA